MHASQPKMKVKLHPKEIALVMSQANVATCVGQVGGLFYLV